jgi:hypothetical protein
MGWEREETVRKGLSVNAIRRRDLEIIFHFSNSYCRQEKIPLDFYMLL